MTWQIDNSHSEVTFTVRHMMISKVRGRFNSFSGTVDFNEADPAASSVAVEIQVDSLDTREAQRDGHLKSPDFFDAAQFPTITFTSTRVEKVDANHGRIVGDLTIHGVTREVVLDTEYSGQSKSPWGTTSAGFSAETKINRKDFGLTWNQALETGGLLVGEDVNIAIELEIVKQPEAAAAPADAEAAA
ncbi:MAG TPA: YceI family protein [Herpetosiphonaceae bacterium]|nr:YceI family protein [Herpetosiphonaceae bacterium]